jgi:hypothetical protein
VRNFFIFLISLEHQHVENRRQDIITGMGARGNPKTANGIQRRKVDARQHPKDEFTQMKFLSGPELPVHKKNVMVQTEQNSRNQD